MVALGIFEAEYDEVGRGKQERLTHYPYLNWFYVRHSCALECRSRKKTVNVRCVKREVGLGQELKSTASHTRAPVAHFKCPQTTVIYDPA